MQRKFLIVEQINWIIIPIQLFHYLFSLSSSFSSFSSFLQHLEISSLEIWKFWKIWKFGKNLEKNQHLEIWTLAVIVSFPFASSYEHWCMRIVHTVLVLVALRQMWAARTIWSWMIPSSLRVSTLCWFFFVVKVFLQ